MQIDINKIVLAETSHRRLDPKLVESLAESLDTLGQRLPVLVFQAEDGAYLLIDGHYRVAAAQKLGWKCIDAELMSGDELDCLLCEVAANLHGAALIEEKGAEDFDEQALRSLLRSRSQYI